MVKYKFYAVPVGLIKLNDYSIFNELSSNSLCINYSNLISKLV